MKEWLTAQELADLRLAQFPATKRGVHLHLQKSDVDLDRLSRPRPGRGGGNEYHLDILPLAARLDYNKRFLGFDPEADSYIREAAEEDRAPGLTARATDQRDARLTVLSVAHRFHQRSGLSQRASDEIFCTLYNLGKIEVPSWVREIVPKTAVRTLANWRRAKRDGRSSDLGVDRAQARRGKGVLDRADGVKDFVLGLLVNQPHLSSHHIRDMLRSEYGEALSITDPKSGEVSLRPVPPARTIQHWLKRLKDDYRVELTAVTNPDRFRGTFRVAGRGVLKHIRRPNQLWQIDASPADVLLTEGRHSIYAVIDIATRRLMIYVSKTPKSSAVGMLLRRAILEWGVPEAIKTDNGSDFVSHESTRLMQALDIEIEVSPAYTPEDKAHVERAIGTYQRDLCSTLPGFIGHSVADRKVIEDRKSFAKRLGEHEGEIFGVELSARQLQEKSDDWCKYKYAHRPHNGLKGRSPFEVYASAEFSPRMVDERALDMLLAPIAAGGGLRTVTKSGVRIEHEHYFAPLVMPGTKVLVRMDPNDLGKAYLFDPHSHEFLSDAVSPSLSGIDPAEAVRTAKAAQKAYIDERTKEARAEARQLTRGRNIADRILDVAKASAPNVIEMPKRPAPHTTPALDAAGDAAGTTPRRSSFEEIERERMARLTEERRRRDEQASNVTALKETPRTRFRRAEEILARIERGENVPPDEAVWVGGYAQTSEYRSLKKVDDFEKSRAQEGGPHGR